MTKFDLYNIFTVNTKIIPPEYLYYQKLGQILNEMRTEHGISFMQIYDELRQMNYAIMNLVDVKYQYINY